MPTSISIQSGRSIAGSRPLIRAYLRCHIVEDHIVRLRKHLAYTVMNAAAVMVGHLERAGTVRHGRLHGVADLTCRGLVTRQPKKRSKSSYIRFEADQPNQMGQAGITH